MEIIGKKSKMENLESESTEWINKSGRTLLWYAVYHANIDVVKYLVANRENREIGYDEKDNELFKAIREKSEIAINILDGSLIIDDHCDELNENTETTENKKQEIKIHANDFNSLDHGLIEQAIMSHCRNSLMQSLLRNGVMYDDTPTGLPHVVMGLPNMLILHCNSNKPSIFSQPRNEECFNKGCGKQILFTSSRPNYRGPYNIFRKLSSSYINHKEDTPLNQALFDNNDEIVEILLEHGADPNMNISETSYNGLFFAIYHRNVKIVHLLLKYDVKLDDRYIELNKYLPNIVDVNQGDEEKLGSIEKLLRYYKNIRKKVILLALFREFGGDNLLSDDNLPRDMFRVIIKHIINPDDEFLAQKEEVVYNGILRWLWSFIG